MMRRVYAASARVTALVAITAPPAFSSAPLALSVSSASGTPLSVKMAVSTMSVLATGSFAAATAVFAAGIYVARMEARFNNKASSLESKLSMEAAELKGALIKEAAALDGKLSKEAAALDGKLGKEAAALDAKLNGIKETIDKAVDAKMVGAKETIDAKIAGFEKAADLKVRPPARAPYPLSCTKRALCPILSLTPLSPTAAVHGKEVNRLFCRGGGAFLQVWGLGFLISLTRVVLCGAFPLSAEALAGALRPRRPLLAARIGCPSTTAA